MQKAIILDLDGTLSNNAHRSYLLHEVPIDWNKVQQTSLTDPCFAWCKNLALAYAKAEHVILVVTARPKSSETVTKAWCKNLFEPLNVPYFLFMREEGDIRPDHEVKRDLYFHSIKHRFEVEVAIDDRDSVVEMWNDIGLAGLKFGCAVDDGVNFFAKENK